jgi:hypothetical protein
MILGFNMAGQCIAEPLDIQALIRNRFSCFMKPLMDRKSFVKAARLLLSEQCVAWRSRGNAEDVQL